LVNKSIKSKFVIIIETMKTKTKKTAKTSKATKSTKEEPTKVSKAWLAFQKNIGTGEILDMRAVLK
jgi:uncharacterized membrane protein